MDCPLCDVTLQLADRQGVEIDYCPKCRGIWLDRGELEKLISLSNGQGEAGSRADPAPGHRDDSHYRRDPPKKRESWLSNLFDFD